jgi:hypothetical protein
LIDVLPANILSITSLKPRGVIWVTLGPLLTWDYTLGTNLNDYDFIPCLVLSGLKPLDGMEIKC